MLRVLHLITSLRVGGAERQLLTLLRAFDRDRIDHTVAVLQSPGALESEVEALDVPLVRLGHRRRNAARTIARTRGLVQSRRIDVVHAHMLLGADYARFARIMGARARVVFTEHQQIEARSGRQRRLERFLRRWTALKITVSDAQREQVLRLEGYPPDTVTTIPNSVVSEEFLVPDGTREQTREELGFDEDAVVIGNVANHIEQKCLDRLIRGFDSVAAQDSRAHLLLVGDGDLHASLRGLASSTRHGGRIHFVGRRRDVPRVLAAMDVFATTSRWEGMPINLLEAMTSGLPSVNMAVGGIPSVITHDREGLLVDEGDEVALSEALLSLVVDPDHRRALGERARERALTDHSASVNVERLAAIYARLKNGEAR